MLAFAVLGCAGIAVALLILWYSRRLVKLEAQVSWLRDEVQSLRALVERLDQEIETTPSRPAPADTREASIPAGERIESDAPSHLPSMPPMAGHTPGLSQYEPPQPRSRGSTELEALVGGNWLLMIGIFAIILGCLYFLKMAFDNRWIGDTGRVLIGSFSGLAFLYGGERFRKKGYKALRPGRRRRRKREKCWTISIRPRGTLMRTLKARPSHYGRLQSQDAILAGPGHS